MYLTKTNISRTHAQTFFFLCTREQLETRFARIIPRSIYYTHGNVLHELDVARTVRSHVDILPRLWAVAFEGRFVLNFSIFVFSFNLSPEFCFSRMFLIYFQNFVSPLRIGRMCVPSTIPSVMFPKSRNISCFSCLFL